MPASEEKFYKGHVAEAVSRSLDKMLSGLYEERKKHVIYSEMATLWAGLNETTA